MNREQLVTKIEKISNDSLNALVAGNKAQVRKLEATRNSLLNDLDQMDAGVTSGRTIYQRIDDLKSQLRSVQVLQNNAISMGAMGFKTNMRGLVREEKEIIAELVQLRARG